MPSVTTVTMSTPSICRGDDERRRLVVGIGRAGADAGDEAVGAGHERAVPFALPGTAPCGRPGRSCAAPPRTDRCAPACRRCCRSGRRRRSCPAGCGTAPGRHRSGRCRRSWPWRGQRRFLGRVGGGDGIVLVAAHVGLPPAQDGGAHAVGRRGHAVNAHADRVMDGVQDRGRGRDQRLLADALGAERADRRGVLDQDRLDRRHVADGRDQIVVQVLAAPRRELLHQRQAETLRDAALDLALRPESD